MEATQRSIADHRNSSIVRTSVADESQEEDAESHNETKSHAKSEVEESSTTTDDDESPVELDLDELNDLCETLRKKVKTFKRKLEQLEVKHMQEVFSNRGFQQNAN